MNLDHASCVWPCKHNGLAASKLRTVSGLIVCVDVASLFISIAVCCAGQAGAKLRTAIENQAKPRVACGLVCNRLHDKAKGTTANELTHRSFDRYTRSCGGTRRYDVLHALVAFQVYQQNGMSTIAGSVISSRRTFV